MSARAVLVCHPNPNVSSSAEFTYWADVDEAEQARDELTPCGPLCGVHIVVRVDVEPDPRRWSLSRTRTTATAADGPDA